MPYKQPDSGNWWISYTDSTGKRVRRSAGTTSFAQARAEENRERANGAIRTAALSARTLDALIVDYLMPRVTIKNKSIARTILRHLGGTMADDLSLQAVSRYVALRRSDGVASGTINRELRFLSAAINEYNRFNGTNIKNNAGAALQQEPAGIVRWITKEEAERLIASARPMVADFIRIALYTGLRKEAVLSLQWTDIDFERGVINVRPKDAPKAKPRAKALPIHPVCREGLLSRKQANGDYPYVFPHRHGKGHAMYMFSGFKSACEAAGIKNFRVHDMRHTLASWLIMAGRPLIEVRDILGHKSVKQSERYAHLAPENLRQAMESI